MVGICTSSEPTSRQILELTNNDTICLQIVGKYGYFILGSDNLINATLYENNLMQDICNNYNSAYCELYGQSIHIADDNHNYNICVNAVVTDTATTVVIDCSERHTVLFIISSSIVIMTGMLSICCVSGIIYFCVLLCASIYYKYIQSSDKEPIQIYDICTHMFRRP